jgi:hypothetical protein
MKTLVEWLLAQRFRPIVFAVAFAPLLPLLSSALLILDASTRGPVPALLRVMFGIAAVWVLAIVTNSSLFMIVGVAAIAMLAGVAIGGVLRWAGALGLAFQATALGCFIATCGFVLLGPSSEVLFEPLVTELVDVLARSEATPEQLDTVRGWGGILLGLSAAGVFAQLVAALLIAYWCLGLVRDDVSFGEEFRTLKLGRVLGFPAMALVALGLVWDVALVQNLTPLALFGFLFQGSAVMHAWAHARQWHIGILVLVYVLFVPPLTGMAILGLSAVGLLDNIFDLRSGLRART